MTHVPRRTPSTSPCWGEPQPSWRPVQAAPRAGGLHRILSRNDDPEAEAWEFASGSLVRCERSRTGRPVRLVAVEHSPGSSLKGVENDSAEPMSWAVIIWSSGLAALAAFNLAL